MRVFYFGCLDLAGHYLYESTNSKSESRIERIRYQNSNPWGDKIDGGLCPLDASGDPTKSEQKEGSALLHYKDGYTALAFWDRSGDIKPGSNSVIIAQGTHDMKTMVDIGTKHFPYVFTRILARGSRSFPIVRAEQ